MAHHLRSNYNPWRYPLLGHTILGCPKTYLLLWVIIGSLPHTSNPSEVAVMHYGHFGGLSLTCKRDELILMESEVLGYSTNRGCSPQPLCSVPYTLAKWYCRGKSTCGGMQVERRPLHKRTCGSEFTNCLRVEYQCVPMSKLTDICTDAIYEAQDGYIRSPSFPEMYPPNRNCSCAVSAGAGDHVQIDTAFFLLKSSRPCRDWLRISVDNDDETTKCGYIPEQKRFIGHNVNINFVSDKYDTEMGFWLRFSGTGGGPVKIRCGRYVNTDEKVTPTIKTPPTTKPTSTSSSTTTTTTTTTVSTTTTAKTTTTKPHLTTRETPVTTLGHPPISSTEAPKPEISTFDIQETSNGPQEHTTGLTTGQPISTESLITEKPTTSVDIDKPETTTRVMDNTKQSRKLLPVETVHDIHITTPVIVVDYHTPTAAYIELNTVTKPRPSELQARPKSGPTRQAYTTEESKTTAPSLQEVIIADEGNDFMTDNKEDLIVKTIPGSDMTLKDTKDNMGNTKNISPERGAIFVDSDPTVGTETTDIVLKDTPDPQDYSHIPSEGQFLPPDPREVDEDILWTSPEYVDLDDDYGVELLSPIEMTAPPGTLFTLPPGRGAVRPTTPAGPMNEKGSIQAVTKGDGDGDKIMTTTNKPTTTPVPMVHFVHYQPAGALSPTLEATEENLNKLIFEVDRNMNMKTTQTPPTTTMKTTTSTTNNPTTRPALITTKASLSPTVSSTTLRPFREGPNTLIRFGEPKNINIQNSFKTTRTTPTIKSESDKIFYEEINKERGDKKYNTKSPFNLQNEILQEKTGHLVVDPTDYPQVVREQVPLGPDGEVEGVDSVDFRSVFKQYVSSKSPHDWRVSLSKAGFPHSKKNFRGYQSTTTPDERLHYVPSRTTFRSQGSIATGEFHPIGDIISLVDEKDLTPTTTTEQPTTPYPPEIVTLRGRLPARYRPGVGTLGRPGGPVNPIGRPMLYPRPGPSLHGRPKDPRDPSQTGWGAPTTPPAIRRPEDGWGVGETPWMMNSSWIPHLVANGEVGGGGGGGGVVGGGLPMPPEITPAPVKRRGGNKDLMWVLIVIAIVLWVVFVALLALLIYHRRRRLTCFRSKEGAWKGPSSPAGRSAALSNKSLLMPSLSAPFTPGARPYVQRRRPTNAETGTQTGRSRLSSGLSWTSVSSLNTAGMGGSRDGANTTTAGIHSRPAAAGPGWTLLPAVPPNIPGAAARPVSPSSRSVTPASRSITPASPVSSPAPSSSSSTQTPRAAVRGRRPQKTSAAQTEVSGSIKSRHHGSHHHSNSSNHHSHRSGHSSGHSTHRSARSRRRAPLPPIPIEWTLTPGGRELRQVPPIHYVHTILRSVPGGSMGSITRPPYDEATTDMTKADVTDENSRDVSKGVNDAVSNEVIYSNEQEVESQNGHGHEKPIPHPRGSSEPHTNVHPSSTQPPISIPPPVQLRTHPKPPVVQRRLSDLSLPPPPPECMPYVPSPGSTIKSRKLSIGSIQDGNSPYSTVKPRHRPRLGLNEPHGWLGSSGGKPQSAKRQSSDSTHSSPPSAKPPPPPTLKKPIRPIGPPILTFPPPPPPPIPPPLPRRQDLPDNSSPDNERKLPLGREDPQDSTPTPPPPLCRGKSAPDVTKSGNLNYDEDDEGLMRRGESAPNMSKDNSPEEKLKGLVPQQAFFFNDKVQPELRRILSKRRFGNNQPVEV